MAAPYKLHHNAILNNSLYINSGANCPPWTDYTYISRGTYFKYVIVDRVRHSSIPF